MTWFVKWTKVYNRGNHNMVQDSGHTLGTTSRIKEKERIKEYS
jgi:hypothetical protein